MTNLFIAPKIKVGYQKRSDTFTGMLAYIIYYDEKGKLRKEKSWESWRSKDIPINEYENTPIEGFTINKDVKRYTGDWFSSTRTMVRIHDPRGFEFEITTENLIGVLMHTDCLRRGLIGKFVYAWAGTELILLPVNSEEYQKGNKYTDGLSKNVKTKELIPGMVYSVKKSKDSKDVTYIGKFDYYGYSRDENSNTSYGLTKKVQKLHIFTKNNGESFFTKKSAEFLSQQISDNIVSNYAELVDMYNSKIYANNIVGFDIKKTNFDPTLHDYTPRPDGYRYCRLKNPVGLVLIDNALIHVDIDVSQKYNNTKREYEDQLEYRLRTYYHSIYYDIASQSLQDISNKYNRYDSYGRRSHNNDILNDTHKPMSIDEIHKIEFYELVVKFENGKSKTIKQLRELYSDY